jgi:nonspecific dipeptidase
MDSFYEYVSNNEAKWIDKLAEAVAIKSVSGSSTLRPEVIRMVHHVAKMIETLGGKATLHEIGTQTMSDGAVVPLPPILTGQIGFDKSKRTVVLYGHLDVQPADLSDGWSTDPFVLTRKNDRLYARGSTDDKAPVLAWFHVVESYKALGKELPVNIKFILEGMEESGSEGLDEFIYGHPEFFTDANDYPVDFVCVSDNYWLGPRKPCVTYGLRGLCYFIVEIRCAGKDLHSGVYGGPIREATMDLVKLFSTLHENDGTIAIKGVQDEVAPMTEEEAKLYESIDFDPEEFRKEAGAPKALRFSTKQDVLTARWRYPTCSIHGMEGAWAGSGPKTVIPASVKGKFSLRLVPDMTPDHVEAVVKAHLEREFEKLNSCNVMTITMLHGAKAWKADPNNSNYASARKAIEKVFKVSPDLTREGGSIPVTLTLEDATKKSVVLLPIGGSDDSAHSQNESISVRNYIEGIKVLGTYLEELAVAAL